MKPGDVVRLKTGDGPVMVVEGLTCGTFLSCLFFVDEEGQFEILHRKEIQENCLKLVDPIPFILDNSPVKDGNIVRLKTGIGPLMVAEGPIGKTFLSCLFFVDEVGQFEILHRKEINKSCLRFVRSGN